MTKETQTDQVPAINGIGELLQKSRCSARNNVNSWRDEVVGTLTAAQDLVTIARMQALRQGHELDLSHPRNDNRPAKFRIVEIDECDGSARFAHLDYAQQGKFSAAWANVTDPVAVGQVVTGYFTFDPAESLSRMEMPTFIFKE